MNKDHIYSPDVMNESFRILEKFNRKFISKTFDNFEEALYYGINNYKSGFRVFA